jgi:competence protein ComEA
MHSVSRWSTNAVEQASACHAGCRAGILRACLLLALPALALAADLPAGPGKAETEKMCGTCHEIERSISPRQDRAAWQATIDKMVSMGATGTPKEMALVLDYLASHYPAPEIDKLNVNKARQIEFESTFGIPRPQAAAIIAYREKNGPFKSIEDLKKVPGVDAAKIEAKKDRIAF